MDATTLDELRRQREALVAEAERARTWARLVRARMDLLTARACPPGPVLSALGMATEGSAPATVGLVGAGRTQHDAGRTQHDDMGDLAALVLGPGLGRGGPLPADGHVDGVPTAAGTGWVERLHALRDARRRLVRYGESLDDAVCWATAALVLETSEGTRSAGRGRRRALAVAPGLTLSDQPVPAPAVQLRAAPDPAEHVHGAIA